MGIQYHLYRNDQRTSVSLDKILSDLLALKLDAEPDTPAGRRVIRAWLQKTVDNDNDFGRQRLSQWLAREAILFLVDKNLSTKYIDWLTRE